MGRAWRNGQTDHDPRIGAGGNVRLRRRPGRAWQRVDRHRGCRGRRDRRGRRPGEGQADRIPVAVVRGLALRDDGSGGHSLVRAAKRTSSGSAPQRLSSSVSNEVASKLSCCAARSDASAGTGRPHGRRGRGRRGPHRPGATPHAAGAVRLGSGPRGALRLLDEMKARWRTDLLADGNPPTPSTGGWNAGGSSTTHRS